MSFTNKHNLPRPFVNLFGKQQYSKGEAHLSVTEMIGSPRISILKQKHASSIQEDIVDKFWALMGTNIHKILEGGADAEHLTEERLYTKVDGWTISGGIDLQRINEKSVDILDWKFVSVLSATSTKPDWERQLNCYAWLVRRVKNVEVRKLEIVAILRDWQKSRTAYERDYPPAPVITIPIPLWPDKTAENFVLDRVRAHKDARRADIWGEDLPECSDEERWGRKESFAVHKRGSGRATRVFSDNKSAEEYAAGKNASSSVGEYEVQRRPGTPIRCSGNYCGVAPFCDQWGRDKALYE